MDVERVFRFKNSRFKIQDSRFKIQDTRFKIQDSILKTMATIKRFEDLEFWQLAREICKKINQYFESNDKFRDYGLKNQIYNSSGSIMDNIAEGFERNGNKEFRQFLSIAKASAGESRSQLYRLKDKEAIKENQFNELYNDLLNLSKQISGFIIN